MATANDKDKGAKPVKQQVLRVVARREGFRRAGFAFGAEPTNLPLGQLTKEQIAALKAEPQLLVTETEIDVPADDAADKTDA